LFLSCPATATMSTEPVKVPAEVQADVKGGIKAFAAEAVDEKDGLIHGVSAAEVQVLCTTSLEARGRAYCEFPLSFRFASSAPKCDGHTERRARRADSECCAPGPYSLFRVGASLLTHTSPTPITGANVENAAYPVGTCAERVAMGTAIHSDPGLAKRGFKALGVATDMDDYCSPCGMCRQFLREFLALETPVFMFSKGGGFIVRTMGELLPLSFGPDVLPPKEALRKNLNEEELRGAGA
jgi:cytidine deaminase